jgi:flagellar biogenesis protein FliO
MDLLQQVAGVLIVLGALGAIVMLGKHRGFMHCAVPVRSNSRPKRLQVLERLALTPQHSLHLVTLDGRTVLVAVSPGGCQLLQNGESPEPGS